MLVLFDAAWLISKPAIVVQSVVVVSEAFMTACCTSTFLHRNRRLASQELRFQELEPTVYSKQFALVSRSLGGAPCQPVYPATISSACFQTPSDSAYLRPSQNAVPSLNSAASSTPCSSSVDSNTTKRPPNCVSHVRRAPAQLEDVLL